MLSVDALKDGLCQAVWSTDNHSPILEALEEMFIDIVKCCRAPHYSCEKFLYQPGEQEDCRTFHQFILNAIHEETRSCVALAIPTFMRETSVHRTVIQAWFRRERSPIIDLFGCMTAQQSYCDSACDSSSAQCYPASFYLTLNLPTDKNFCSLQDCLRLWSSEEKYTSKEGCNNCHLHEKKSFLKMGRLSPVLIIHLASSWTNSNSRKNDCFVDYGHNLDMKEFVIDGLQTNTNYSLVAVTLHSGDTDSDGTYIMSNVELSSDYQDFSDPDYDEPPAKKKIKSVTEKEIVIPPKNLAPAPKGKTTISFQQSAEDIQSCNHEVDLDIRDPVLERGDVDGGDVDLEKLDLYKKPQLERLMRMYGLPVPSDIRKNEKVNRIRTHVARGKGEIVIPGFEAGYWHKRKRTRLMVSEIMPQLFSLYSLGLIYESV
ncbi:Ubiquitin carboxyl-terminal hydrolase 8 [Frankliniella fusca]|uniref:ubiquitinyl hydrolase 1 n=1 Tax=Frankliniella fusca TaxID=407009 RepID=A0AAE1GYZ3_9NEOP|nr:Ubiquitin carboxyl-terminal hydrolase 8 [Frankliniella fusca]